MSNLPTPAEIIAKANAELNQAYRALGDARDWLLSDWDVQPTAEQAATIRRMREAIGTAKDAINEGRP
ncbi:hypothetical protein ACIODS_11710 [Micromonospora chalcea]|uniref:hypothetical protein n=1 Tax=Micromonospora chalcea TaxID=1874 RepID=UPI00380E2798